MVLQTQIVFSGSRKVVDQKNRWVYTINPPFFRLEKSGSANLDFFLVREKWLTRKKNPSLQNHFSGTPFLEKGLQIKWLSAFQTAELHSVIKNGFHSPNSL